MDALGSSYQEPARQPPAFVPVVHVRLIDPVVRFMIVKNEPDRDCDTIVKSSVPARAATDPAPGGMASSIGRFVLTIVAFDVQLEYVCESLKQASTCETMFRASDFAAES